MDPEIKARQENKQKLMRQRGLSKKSRSKMIRRERIVNSPLTTDRDSEYINSFYDWSPSFRCVRCHRWDYQCDCYDYPSDWEDDDW